MKQLRLFSVMLIASLLFAACSKDKTAPNTNNNNNGNNNQPTKTPKELIVGTWKLTSMVYKTGGDNTPDCNKDNTVAFKADGTYTYDQGDVKCNPQQVQTADGTWNLDEYPKFKFKLNSNPDFETVTIQKLDETTLTYLQYEGEQSEVTVTMKRQ